MTIRTFRDVLDEFRRRDRLIDVAGAVDIRYLPALVAQSDKALLFRDVAGYDMPVASGLVNGRESLALALGCAYDEIEGRFVRGMADPIPPEMLPTGPVRAVFAAGGEVDLCRLPVPLSALQDGGPMITAGLTIVRDPEGGLNAGVYRYQVKERNLTGIDLVTPNNLRAFAEAALAEGRAIPMSISIGTHPIENMCATISAPIGTNELAFAGGVRGAPVALAPCETIDLPCIADAEIVLEAELLPTGWTKPEGRFGEFTQVMGDLHWNPHVRIKAVSMRTDPIYYALHMPWEVIWLLPPIQEAQYRRALREAGIDVVAVNVTPAASCYFHVAISIRKQAGDGKNAILAAMAGAGGLVKQVIVVDDDIDVYDPAQLEWAVATRVQADRDVVIVPGARAKPLDPSIPPTPGRIPTAAKMGIDATIADDVPRERFRRIAHAYMDEVSLDNCVDLSRNAAPAGVADLPAAIRESIGAGPLYFSAISERFRGEPFQAVLRAVVGLQEEGVLWQDADGRLCLADSPFAARPPGQ